jgi:branched-chain amino acid transport system permease protein
MEQQFEIRRSTPASRFGMALFVITIAVLALAPWWAGRANMRLLGEIYSFMALACLWNLLAGYTGLVSVGQQAWVGFGGYALFALAMFLGVHPLLAIVIAGVAAAILALPIAPLLFRRLFRNRHLGSGRGLPPLLRTGLHARRGLGLEPADIGDHPDDEEPRPA